MLASSLTGCKPMKTYYDGEEREVISITPYYFAPKMGQVWLVLYKCGGRRGELLVPATDELDAFNKFPEYLDAYSINYEE